MTESDTSALSHVFVGRKHELSQLRACLEKTDAGMGRFIVISGEEGIGKSTLVQHFANEAKNAGAIFISVNFNPLHSYEPYAPFIKIIDQLRDAKSPGTFNLAAITESSSTTQGKHFHDQSKWDIESLYSLQTKQGLAQQKLLSLIVEAAKQRLLLISLNEVHCAPLTAWKFIHYLCESITEYRILVIATLRQDGKEMRQEQVPVYADVLQRMNREGLVEKMPLQRFDEKDIRELLHITFHRRDFSSQFIPFLYEVTGGVPEQVKKCITKLLHKGIIFQQDEVWFHQEDLTKEYLFELVSDDQDLQAAAEMIKQLSTNQKDLLQYAALMNESFNHRFLSVITKRPRVQVLKDLLSLKENKFLSQVEEESYKFKQTAIRSAVLEQLPPAEKVTKHQRIAENIEAADNLEAREKIYLLAYHYSQTEDKLSAFRYLCRASDLAIENFAFLEAKDFIKQALDLRNSLSDEKDRAEIVHLLIWAAWLDRLLGYWDDSIEHCKAALELFGENTDFRLKNQILIQQGLSYFRLNDWKNAQACFERCLNDKQNLGQFDLAMVHYGLGNVHFELANYERSYNYFEQALSLAQELEARQLMANVINNLGALENVRSHRMRAVALYSQIIPIYKKLGDNLGLARIYHNIGMTYADERNWQQANEFYGQSLSVSDVMGLIPLKSITFLNRALALAHLGKFD
ncbi:MAG: BREX system ATP-binding domain-containing protein, partial [bacterium]